MGRTIAAAMFFVLLLSTPAFGQRNPWPLPSDYPRFPTAGMTEFQGTLDQACAGLPVYIYAGTGPEGVLLGSSLVNPDGSFSVTLNRPLAEDETMTVFAECRDGAYVWDIFHIPPPIIPEPTTLVLVGSGLGLLALRRLWH